MTILFVFHLSSPSKIIFFIDSDYLSSRWYFSLPMTILIQNGCFSSPLAITVQNILHCHWLSWPEMVFFIASDYIRPKLIFLSPVTILVENRIFHCQWLYWSKMVFFIALEQNCIFHRYWLSWCQMLFFIASQDKLANQIYLVVTYIYSNVYTCTPLTIYLSTEKHQYFIFGHRRRSVEKFAPTLKKSFPTKKNLMLVNLVWFTEDGWVESSSAPIRINNYFNLFNG